MSASAPTSRENTSPPVQARHPREAADRADLAQIEEIGAQRIDEHRDRLVGETAEAKKGDGRIGRRDETDAARPDHHQCGENDAPDARPHQRDAEGFHQERRDIAAKHAAEIRRQERQPGEESDLLQVHVPLARHVEGNPEAERLPRRFGEEARNGDRPEAPRREELRRRGLTRGSVRVGLPRQDLLALAGRKQSVLARRAVEGVPERRPEKADCAGDDEGPAPAERQRDRGDERRRDQRAERGADVEEADRDRLLLVRKPFRDRLHAGGNRRRFGPHPRAPASESQPVTPPAGSRRSTTAPRTARSRAAGR